MVQHFARSPHGLQKRCCPTPTKGMVVTRDVNTKGLVGLATLPKLVHVLLQLAHYLLGDVLPICGLVQEAG